MAKFSSKRGLIDLNSSESEVQESEVQSLEFRRPKKNRDPFAFRSNLL